MGSAWLHPYRSVVLDAEVVHTVSLGIACGLPCQVLQLSTLNNNDSGGRLNHDDDDDDDHDDNDDYDEVMSFCSSDDVYPLC